MNINKVSSEELKKNPKKYAKECTTDQLLDALNLCKQDEERKQVITEILNMKPQVEKEIVKKFKSSKCLKQTLIDAVDTTMKYDNRHLDGKKHIPWHCAFNDSPSGLRLHGEDVVQYDLWDEYIPCDNHASSLELLNKINTASVKELERMYSEKSDDDLEFWKILHKDDKKGYLLFLKDILLIEFIDIIDMYKNGDRFMVAKATYKGKEIFDWKYINCWYVDICSEKTKKIYRVLSH